MSIHCAPLYQPLQALLIAFSSLVAAHPPSHFCCVSPTALPVARILLPLCNASKALPGLTVSVLQLKSCELLLASRLKEITEEIIERPWSHCCSRSGCPVMSNLSGPRGFQIKEHEQRGNTGNYCHWDYVFTGSPSVFSCVKSKPATKQTKEHKRGRRKKGRYKALIRSKSWRESAHLRFCMG